MRTGQLIATATLVFSIFGCGGEDGTTFNDATWKSERGVRCDRSDVRHERQAMVDDLLGQHLDVGMPQRAVRELLGPPDETGRSPNGIWWTYFTGNDQLDCLTVTVSFQDGRVTEAREGQT